MRTKYFLTTPLYYVNAKPHIGHAYTEIAADASARYMRLHLGEENVHFLTGTDEHGQKIARAAQETGLEPKDFTNKISETFKELWKTLTISYDDFIRTTEDRHRETVRYVWEKIKAAEVEVKGKKEKVLYLHTYDGYYCVSCETFITEGLLDEKNPSSCPQCKKPLERMKEETYFFRVSAYQDRLINDTREGRMRILPESRKNEVLGFLKHNRLTDLSISRPKSRLAWGIPLPFDDNHVTYVWFDALINYISACGYGRDDTMFKKWWPANVHIIGKDILRHHAVLWPTFLYALDIELPELIFAHGWWVQGGEKMSKSRGNVIDPAEIISRYGVDALRYFLLRETPFGQDGVFTEEALVLRYNTDLANDLGNLLYRTLTMCQKYFGDEIPKYVELGQRSAQGHYWDYMDLRLSALKLFERLEPFMARLAFSESLQEIWELINKANKYVEGAAPWTLFKEGRVRELEAVVLSLIETLRLIGIAVWPFMPQTGETILSQLGIESTILDHVRKFPKDQGYFYTKGGRTAKGAPLFPRIENTPKI